MIWHLTTKDIYISIQAKNNENGASIFDLFSLNAEVIIQNVTHRLDHMRFSMNGVNIQNVRYNEDTMLLAISKADL